MMASILPGWKQCEVPGVHIYLGVWVPAESEFVACGSSAGPLQHRCLESMIQQGLHRREMTFSALFVGTDMTQIPT